MQVWLNAKARLCGRAFFSYSFYFNGLKETKMPNLADLFLDCKWLGFVCVDGFCVGVFGVLGLDMRICWVFGSIC